MGVLLAVAAVAVARGGLFVFIYLLKRLDVRTLKTEPLGARTITRASIHRCHVGRVNQLAGPAAGLAAYACVVLYFYLHFIVFFLPSNLSSIAHH